MIDFEGQKLVKVDIEDKMKEFYINYAMNVIVGRALPDVRDGLKPVHRRILYSSFEKNLTPDKPYRKSAKIVGDVLGQYHPHGDAAVYDSLVRMAQDFSLRYPLIDGQGNFGSIDGDGAAAYRYTEARMSKLAVKMLDDIKKETVEFVPNFDNNDKEPLVLPSRFPNLLVNGSTGIAVGMASSVPPHNLCEVIDAISAVLDDENITLDEIMEYIKGPDFPTGGIIMGKSGIRAAYATGRGKIIVRAKTEIQEFKEGRFKIVVTEIPYMVNKSRLIESIADQVKNKRIDGISFIRDDSDRNGMSIVIELKRDAYPQVVLNKLFSYTQLQSTFSVIMLALVENQTQPKILSLREMLDEYIAFQKEIITKRTRYDLKKARERAHILEGCRVALDHIDEVIKIIRASKSIGIAKASLIERFGFSDVQAQYIVDMRLGQLTGMEREKIDNEFNELMTKIHDFEDILNNDSHVKAILKDELTQIRDKFGDARRTEICAVENEIDIEDLIADEQSVITYTHYGYIKRLPTTTYKAQRRGGRGISAMSTREEDFVEELFIASTHDYIMFFTSKGRAFKLKCYQIPESSRTAKGTNIVNLLELEADEKVYAMIKMKDFDDENLNLMMVTRKGITKRTCVNEFRNIRKGGIRAITLDEDDELVRVKLTGGSDEMMIGTRNGMTIRFNETDVRKMGRTARGVHGIRLRAGDYVIGMSKVIEDGKLLSITQNGFAKRTDLSEYKLQNRGGMGVHGHGVNDKTGKIAMMKVVMDDEDIMIISSDGTIIRTGASGISCFGRTAKGVKTMRLAEGVEVVTFARTEKEEDIDAEIDIDNNIDDNIAAADDNNEINQSDETNENILNENADDTNE